jgi:hypothetical protein
MMLEGPGYEIFLKSVVKISKCWGVPPPLSAPEGGPTLARGSVGSHSELVKVRNSEHSFYFFEIKHVNSLEI